MKGNELAAKTSTFFVPLKGWGGYDVAPTISFVMMYAIVVGHRTLFAIPHIVSAKAQLVE